MTVNGQGDLLDGVFQLEERVTWGGMGEIWRGRDLRTGQVIAVKRVPDHVEDGSGRLRDRLIREAQAIAAITHPHVVRHIAAGFDQQGSPYLILEWLQGENLETLRRKGILTYAQIIEIVRQILKGLDVCHRQGIVHRDIKPGNIFLAREGSGDDVTVKLIDFGLALMTDNSTRMTADGEIMGTLYYLSPEQAQGLEHTGPATDIYSVGVVLYELLTGRPPFRAEKPLAVMLKIVTETPPRPRQLQPDLPTWLESVILRAMARDPNARYPTAAKMARALAGSLGSTLQGPPPVVPPPRPSAETPKAPPRPLLTSEYRLVSLLCARAHETTNTSALEATARPAVERGGGVLHHLLGGQFIAIYGLDETDGDEALRATRAGLTLRSQVGESTSFLVATIHLLINEGVQLVSDELDDALALLAQIPRGALVLDAASQDLTRGRVKLRHRGQHKVVDDLTSDDGERPVLGVTTPTVGRTQELAYLRRLFDEVKTKRLPRAVILSGAPGLGKSRLCRTILGELRPQSNLTFEARAVATKKRTPYALLSEGLAQVMNIHSDDDDTHRRETLETFVHTYVNPEHHEEVAVFLGEAMGLSFQATTLRWTETLARKLSALRVARANPQMMRQKIVDAAERLLIDATHDGPITMLFEDLHWADEESLLVFGTLVERLRTVPIFFIGTCRPEFLERDLPWLTKLRHRIALAPLEERAMTRLLRAILGRIERGHERRMLDWCDGNPYFAEELVSWMVARKLMIFGKAGWQLVDGQEDVELPAGIEGAIQGRLDRLTPSQRELLKAASIFGEIFWESALAALDIPNLSRDLERLAALEFIAAASESSVAGTRQWFFRHTLLVQVLYRMVPETRRQLLHRRAAEWLKSVGEDDPEVLAQHYERGGDALRATAQHTRIAQRALADGHLDRALAYFNTVLTKVDVELPRAQHLESLLGLAKTQLFRSDLSAVEATIAEMIRQDAEADPRLAAEVSFLRGRVALIHGHHDEAQALLEAAIQSFAAQEETHRAFEVKHALFAAIWVEGRYDDAIPLAKALHREAAPERPEQLCAAKLASAFHQLIRGDLSTAITLAGQAADHARACDHLFWEADALATLGAAREIAGLYELALTSLAQAEEIAKRLETTHHRTHLQSIHSRLDLSRGDLPSAIAHAKSAIESAERLGDERALAIGLASRARARLRLVTRGNESASLLTEARDDADRAVSLTTHRSPPDAIVTALVLSEVLSAQGDAERAAATVQEGVTRLDRLGAHERYEVELLLHAHRSHEAIGAHGAAMSYLQRAWHALHRRGERISLPAVRESFYHGVPTNEAVSRLWRERETSR